MRRRGYWATRAARQATAAGDGFADGFPTAALVELLKGRLDKPLLFKADWVEIGTISRT
jgi:hypothetical protein